MDGPLGTQKQSKQEDVKIWKDEKDIELLSMVKFAQEFLILIMQTAALLNVVTAENPWSMGVQFTNPVVMLVMNGIMSVDTFFMVSAFLGFF